MATYKCKMCGGSLEIAEGMTVCECEYCGTQQTLPKTDNEQTLSMFNRANHFRQQCEFDKAAEIYERMTAQSDDAELYWSIVLCRYGIEYVDDPLMHKKIATCHRTQYKSILEDADYLEALSHADSIQRSVYEREAAYIDKVQKGILEISIKEEPFDVFICYKESDQNGRRTQDSVLAQELYYQLEREGFKVFFSRITLESKLGTEYEPYIFAALNSARVMVVVGTKPEYFNAVWVKNEWSRYLMLMQQDRSRVLIPAYKDMDPYDLPDALSLFQAQDMSKLGFMQDLIRGISKIANKDEPKLAAAPASVQTVVQKASGNIENLLKRGFLSLEDKKWDDANRFFEDVLNENVEEPRAYIGKLCAEKNVMSEKELVTLQEDYSSSDNYRKACRFGGEEVETRLHGYILQGISDKAEDMLNNAYTVEECNAAKKLFVWLGKYKDMSSQIETCDNKVLKIRYDRADDMLKSARSKNEYKNVAKVFAQLGDYLDSSEKVKECQRKAEICHKDEIYQNAISKLNDSNMERSLELGKELFESIKGYKDSDDRAEECQRKIDELREANQKRIQAEEKEAKRKKQVTLVVCFLIVAIIIGVIIFFNFILPKIKYSKAIDFLGNKNYDKAISTFESLNGYKDSEKKIIETKYMKADDCLETNNFDLAISTFESLNGYKDSEDKVIEAKYRKAVSLFESGNYKESYYIFRSINTYKESLKYLNSSEFDLRIFDVNDVVSFGKYDWYIIGKTESDMTLLCKNVVCEKAYNESEKETTWENCTLRYWLNNDFYYTFSDSERDIIAETICKNINNVKQGTTGGNTTIDYIYIPNIDHISFIDVNLRACNSKWWLRSSGGKQNMASAIEEDGKINEIGYDVNKKHGVRPVLTIKLQ